MKMPTKEEHFYFLINFFKYINTISEKIKNRIVYFLNKININFKVFDINHELFFYFYINKYISEIDINLKLEINGKTLLMIILENYESKIIYFFNFLIEKFSNVIDTTIICNNNFNIYHYLVKNEFYDNYLMEFFFMYNPIIDQNVLNILFEKECENKYVLDSYYYKTIKKLINTNKIKYSEELFIKSLYKSKLFDLFYSTFSKNIIITLNNLIKLLNISLNLNIYSYNNFLDIIKSSEINMNTKINNVPLFNIFMRDLMLFNDTINKKEAKVRLFLKKFEYINFYAIDNKGKNILEIIPENYKKIILKN